MMKMRHLRRLTMIAALTLAVSSAGAGAEVRVERLYEVPLPRTALPMTMRQDALGREFLYVATKDEGLRIYDARGTKALLRTVRSADFGGMHAMSLTQEGDRLYLALGNHWGRAAGAGLAVVDIRDPRQAAVLGWWKEPSKAGAGGAVEVRQGLAFLAAMGSGVYALDARNPAAVRLLGHLKPDLAFPDRRPDAKKINARGLALRGAQLFVCYDAGGVRVLDVSDPRRLREVGRYSNPAMNGKPRAYNNLVVHGSLAYVTADYVGVEVLDVSDPTAPRPVSWWNPWNPGLVGLKWFGSPGHANEIALDPQRKRLFVSAGRSDLVVLDVSDPANPRAIGGYGKVDDTQATWGVSRHGDRVYLSYICTLGIPFRADWVGIRAVRVSDP